MTHDFDHPTNDSNRNDWNAASASQPSVPSVPIWPSVGSDIANAALAVNVGDPSVMLTEVRKTVAKRRRRRHAVVGVAAAGTLVMSGVVIANVIDTDGVESFSTSTDPANEADQTTPTTVLDSTLESTVPTIPVPPTPVVPVPVVGERLTDPGLDAEAAEQAPAQLLEWKGGFLAIRTVTDPQPLPTELPPEVVDQFPQEVLDLFADGLPATIEEATAMLQEAGLLDEVSEIVTSNSAVSDAIYAGEALVTTTARFSPDGIEWSDIELALPEGVVPWTMVSTGDRLVAMNNPYADLGPGDSESPTSFDVLSTTDLITWTTQTVTAPERPVDLPEFVDVESIPGSLVANDSRWMLTMGLYQSVDVLSLIDPVLRAEFESSSGGFDTSWDEDGVTINVYPEPEVFEDPDSASTGTDVPAPSQDDVFTPTTFTFTWTELGVDASTVPDPGPVEGSTIWTSDGAGEPVASPGFSGQYGMPVAIDGGFVIPVADGIEFSTDGVTWSAAALPEGNRVEALLPAGDTVVAFTALGTEALAYELDTATLAWSVLDIPGLPEGLSPSIVSNGAIALYSSGSSIGEFASTRFSADVEGYRLELLTNLTGDSRGFSYTITEVSTGRIVSTESSDDLSQEDPFEFLEVGETDEIVALDPESKTELFVVPSDAITIEYIGPDGEVVGTEDAERPTTVGDSAEWIIATDGTTWLVEQGPAESAESGGVGGIAFANGVVLAAHYDGTFTRYELG
jgi:hypothetical protein